MGIRKIASLCCLAALVCGVFWGQKHNLGNADNVTKAAAPMTTQNAVPVVNASGELVESPLKVDPTTGEVSSTSSASTVFTFTDSSSDPSAPGASLTSLYSYGGLLKYISGASGTATTILDKTLTQSKSITLFSPATGDSGEIQFNFGQAVTITRVACSTHGSGTSVTINLNKRSEATPDTSGTDVLSSGLVCDTDSQTSCSSGCSVNTITSASVAAHDPVALTISAVSGTPSVLRVHVEYTLQ